MPAIGSLINIFIVPFQKRNIKSFYLLTNGEFLYCPLSGMTL